MVRRIALLTVLAVVVFFIVVLITSIVTTASWDNEDEFSTINMDLIMFYPPPLDCPGMLICTLKAFKDEPGTIVTINRYYRDEYPITTDNVAQFTVDLKAGQTSTLTTKVAFERAGKWALEGNAYNPNPRGGRGRDEVYMLIRPLFSTFGWPSGPTRIQPVQ
jgi:hypothetical protein